MSERDEVRFDRRALLKASSWGAAALTFAGSPIAAAAMRDLTRPMYKPNGADSVATTLILEPGVTTLMVSEAYRSAAACGRCRPMPSHPLRISGGYSSPRWTRLRNGLPFRVIAPVLTPTPLPRKNCSLRLGFHS